jgi:O-antigen/teichoic acid export membrane protein
LTTETKIEDSKRVAAGAGLVTTARTVGGVLNLLLVISLTRLLSKDDFAIVVATFMVHEIINAIGPLGLPSALSFFVPKLGGRCRRALGVVTGGLLFSMAVPFALALAFGGPEVAALIGKPELGIPLAILSVAVLADFPGQTLPNFLIAKESYIGAFWITLLFYLSRFASFVVPAYLGYGPEVIIWCFAGVAVLRALCFVIHFSFIERGGLSGDAREGWSIRELFSYGAPLSASLIVGKLNVQIDKYMILYLLTPAAFAVFTVGAVELPLVSSLAYSVTTALVPTLVKAHQAGDTARFVALWHGSMTKVAAIMMPLFVFFMIFAEPTMRVFFSSSYEGAALPFRVYLCLLPLRLCGYGAVVRAVGETKPVLLAAGAGLVTNLVLNYPLYTLFGMAGPAMASVLAQCVAIGILLWCIKQRLNVREIFPVRPVTKALVIAAVSAAPAWATHGLVDEDSLRLLVGVLCYLPTYLALSLWSGVVTRGDLRYVKELVTGRIMSRAKSGERS